MSKNKLQTRKYIKRLFKDLKKSGWKSLKVFFLTIFLLLIIKLIFIDFIRVRSVSMEDKFTIGDLLILNKIAYSFNMPDNIPFTNIPIPTFSIPFSGPGKGDIVAAYIVAENNQNYSNSELTVKRCVAIPGDKLQIIQRKIFVNDKPSKLNNNLKFIKNYLLPEGFADKRIIFGDNWNQDNFGPVILPVKGETIKISNYNLFWISKIIKSENRDSTVNLVNGKIEINGKINETYNVKQNYYFLLGDNIDESYDSRFFGPVAQEFIFGEVCFIF